MRSIRASRPGESVSGAALTLERLCVRYPSTQAQAVVQDLSLEVLAGECLGVVGESGAGKSQAFLAAMGLLPVAARVSGSVRLGDTELLGLSAAEWRGVRGTRASMVFQDPASALSPHRTIGDQIAETLVSHRGASRRTARARALELLALMHLSDPQRRIDQYPHELSGGMRQRAMLAIALACEPALLIADEPTTALDVTIQAQILALLAQVRRERGMTLVLITHDLGVIAGLADRVAVMQSGRLVELAPAAQLFRAPEHPHTRALLAASTAAGATSPRATAPAPGAPLIQVRGLRVQYRLRDRARTRLTALTELSFVLGSGGSLAVVGESGSGKTTLLRALLRLLPPSAGTIEWRGRGLAQLSGAALRATRRDFQLVFQDPAGSLDPRMTVEQIVAEPLELHRRELDAAQRSQAVAAMLADVGLGAEHARRFPHELSGGQCQRVAIARAMILQPQLLLCDEPVAALDLTTQQHILDLLAAVRGPHGTALLVVTHNLAAVRRLCEHVLVLYLGRAMECAPTHTLLEQPLHPYTRALLEAAPIADPQRQRDRLAHVLGGEPPSVATPPSGCVFRTRCPHALALCAERAPSWEEAAPDHFVACHRAAELSGRRNGPEPVWPASQPARAPASADAATTRTRYPRLDEEGT